MSGNDTKDTYRLSPFQFIDKNELKPTPHLRYSKRFGFTKTVTGVNVRMPISYLQQLWSNGEKEEWREIEVGEDLTLNGDKK